MKQTEVTVKVLDDENEIFEILRKQGFEVVEKYSLKDHYFSKLQTQELKEMTYKQIMENAFLVRQIKDTESKNLLVFKNKVVDENNVVIEEEKITCQVEDLENTIKIFNFAKLNCWCQLNQHITVFKHCEIELCLSVIENLGAFIEFEEYPKLSGLSAYQKIESMKTTLKELGLKLGEDFSCKKPYLMFLKTLNS